VVKSGGSASMCDIGGIGIDDGMPQADGPARQRIRCVRANTNRTVSIPRPRPRSQPSSQPNTRRDRNLSPPPPPPPSQLHSQAQNTSTQSSRYTLMSARYAHAHFGHLWWGFFYSPLKSSRLLDELRTTATEEGFAGRSAGLTFSRNDTIPSSKSAINAHLGISQADQNAWTPGTTRGIILRETDPMV
jgi:hypothetical protein